MDRFANLEVVLEAAGDAVKARDWIASEKLSERIRSIVLDMAMADDRDALARARDRMMAFRVVAGEKLNRSDPADLRCAMSLRYDASLAAIAARMRPRAVSTVVDKEIGSAQERVLKFLLERAGGATTGAIVQQIGLAQGTVSKVLTALKAQGLVTSRQAGKHRISRLTPRGRKAAGERPQRPRPQQILRIYSPMPMPLANFANCSRAMEEVLSAAPHGFSAVEEERSSEDLPDWFSYPDGAARSALNEEDTPTNTYASALG